MRVRTSTAPARIVRLLNYPEWRMSMRKMLIFNDARLTCSAAAYGGYVYGPTLNDRQDSCHVL